MKTFIKLIAVCFLVLSSVDTSVGGDLVCYGYTSTTSWFACGSHGNCTWWAAYKRPDLAAAGITGNAGLWYDNAKNLGFNVGSQPKVGATAVFWINNDIQRGHVAHTESFGENGAIKVSEMDYYKSVGFVDGVNYATYYPNGDGTYNRNGGSTRWTLRGFIYNRLFVPKVGQHLCARGKGVYGICWDIVSLSNISCQGGKNWEAFPNDWELESAYVVSDGRYCPDDGGIGGSGPVSESPGTPPISGSDNSGSLPDLVMRDVYLEDGDQRPVTRLHIGEKGHCHMSVINNGEVKARGTFENRCWVSVGDHFDGTDDAESIGKEDMDDLDNGQSRVSHEDFYASEYPGKRNLVGCTDASEKVVESNERNNCNLGDHAVLQEYRFEVWSNPNLATTVIDIGGKSSLAVGEAFVVSSTTANPGENFGPDYVYIGYFIDGNYVGRNQIRRENMKGGMNKTESLFVPGGIATAGVHEVKACADFTGDIAETNETDNCMTLLVNVKAPVPPSLSITGLALAGGTRHVFTDDRQDISVSIGNAGGSSSPVSGEVFISEVPFGVEKIPMGTFQVGAIPEGGSAIGTLSGVSFTRLGPWQLTACLEGNAICASGDVVTVESSHPTNKHMDPALIMMINRHRQERYEQ